MIMHDDDTYGAPKSMIKLAELLKNNFEVEPIIVTPFKNKVNSKCDELGIENYFIPNWRYYVNRKRNPLEPAINYLIHKTLDLYFYRKITKLIDFSSIDIIHSAVSVVSHGHELSKKFNIPHIWHLRELDPYKDYFTQDQLEDMSINTTKFIAISNVVKNYWIDLGLPEKKIETIYNGIDEKQINAKVSYDLSSGLDFVLAGRINPNKQIDVALKAISRLEPEIRKDITLTIYGDATKLYKKYQADLLKLVDKNQLSNQVIFKGYQSNISQILCNYDSALMTSRQEAFGRTTVEYMLAGLPVIASNTGANVELIDNGINGLFYQDDNSDDLSEKIKYLYERKEQLAILGNNARKKALEKYTSADNAKNVFELYKKVLKK